MSGRTYEYEVYSNVAGCEDLISKLRSFGLANGWSSLEYQTNVIWEDDGGWGWGTGSEDFLDIRSTGYGNQALRYRFRVRTDPAVTGESSDHWVNAYANFNTAYSAVSTHPSQQNRWGGWPSNYGRMVLPSGSIYKVHFIGDETLIVCVMELSPLVSWSFGIGTWELFPEFQNTDQAMMYRSGINTYRVQDWQVFINSTTSNRTYFSTWCGDMYVVYMTDHTPWYMFDTAFTYQNGCDSLECRNCEDAVEVQDLAGRGFRQRRLLGSNPFSNARPMIQPSLYLEDPNQGDRNICVGNEPYYYCVFTGLSVGQFLEHGSDTYVVFPWVDYHRTIGWAMKVNV